MIHLFIIILLSALTTGVITSFLGYWVHWIFHQPWSRWFYHAHMNHHIIQYPPSSFLSDKYKSAGRDSTVILFIVAFAPVLVGIVLFTILGILSLTTGICSLICLTIWGLAHDYFHDQFHISGSYWTKFKFFLIWRDIHYIHHLDMSKNYGIVSFQWDKVFKTYFEADITLDEGNNEL